MGAELQVKILVNSVSVSGHCGHRAIYTLNSFQVAVLFADHPEIDRIDDFLVPNQSLNS